MDQPTYILWQYNLFESEILELFLSDKQAFKVQMLQSRSSPIVLREVHNSSIDVIYHKWPKNTLNDRKARNQVFQPHGLINSLITRNILYFHGGGTIKNL